MKFLYMLCAVLVTTLSFQKSAALSLQELEQKKQQLFKSKEDVTQKAEEIANLLKTLSEGAETFCGKANFFGGKYTVRSLEGNFCTNPDVAAIAELVCPSTDKKTGYMKSKCHANASQLFRLQDDMVRRLVQNPASVAEPLCAIKDIAGPLKPVTDQICSK